MKRAVAWTLLVVACVGGLAGLVLGLVGEYRGIDLTSGNGSDLLVQVVAAIAAVLFGVVGLLIAEKERANPIGWIFLGSAAVLGVMDASYGYADLAINGGEGWPAAQWSAWLASWMIILPFVAPCWIAQLFPDGRSISGRWRWILRVSVAMGLYLILAPAFDAGGLALYPDVDNPTHPPEWVARFIVDLVWAVAIFALFGLSLASIVTRYRRSRGLERKQLTLLAFAGSLVILAFSATFAADSFGGVLQTVFSALGLLGFMLMPVAVAVAILRYRLYEIDRLISRTLVYALLTIILGAAYVGLVLAGQALFSSFAGGSNLAIASSTLVVAALFLPARSRIQRFVDRRFYRRRYDAQRTLEAFGGRLREQVELDALAIDLAAVVGETMQPEHVGVWLRERRA